ncbi:hypothetical protein GCM10023116_20830 [Kistimonas scapharcae]|uniref:Uncharacterized protein n=1 Tax=Kistimonas scapharcae TaxID=1036133 RepID=A0ABP8V4H9_9GAMM
MKSPYVPVFEYLPEINGVFPPGIGFQESFQFGCGFCEFRQIVSALMQITGVKARWRYRG